MNLRPSALLDVLSGRRNVQAQVKRHLVIDQVDHHLPNHAVKSFTPKHLLALRVNQSALLVHDSVVLEQIAANLEVIHLDLLLRPLDRAAYPGV